MDGAQFLGSPRMNLLRLSMAGEGLRFAVGPVAMGFGRAAEVAQIGIRPEDCRLVAPADGYVTGTVQA